MAAMAFEKWCSYKETVMGEPPQWFHDPAERKRRYQAYRAAYDGNCIAADPTDAAFSSMLAATRRPDTVDSVVPPAHIVHMSVPSGSVTRRLWSVVVVVLVNLMVLAGPVFAGNGDVLVNGETLALQDRAALEAMVGPLRAGRYWARENGDFGRDGTKEPIANLRHVMQQRVQAAQMQRQYQQQMLRQRLAAQAILNAMRQRQAMQRGRNGYMYGNRFSSGERDNNGSWSHYNGYSNYGVGGTGDGCIYTPNWSNC